MSDDYSLDSLPQNIREKIKVIAGHWIWIGATTIRKHSTSQGRLRFNGKMEYPHRVVFHLLTGFDLKSELQVNHKQECQLSLCCHPNHLYAGTQKENVDDGAAFRRLKSLQDTHCKVCGSEWKISPTTGWRYCSTCKNRRGDMWRAKKRGLIVPQEND